MWFNDFYLLEIMLFGVISFSLYTLYTRRKLKELNRSLLLQTIEYNSIIKNANCGILHVNQKGQVRHQNDIFINLLGKKISNFEEYTNLLEEGQRKFFLLHVQEEKDATFDQFFINYKEKSTSLNIYISFLKDTKDLILVATSNEDKVQLQRALEMSKIFFNNSGLAQVIISEKFKILDTNDVFIELLGYARDEIHNQHISMIFPSKLLFETFAKNYITDKDLKAQGNIEYRFKKRDGTLFWIELIGSNFLSNGKNYTIWSIKDITHRVNTRETIRLLNNQLKGEIQKLEDIISILPMPIFIKDKDFRYIECNDEFCKFLNLTRDQIINKTVFEMFSNIEAQKFHDMDAMMVYNATQTYEANMKSRGKQIEIHKRTIYANGLFNGFVGIINDITERENQKTYLENRVKEELEKNIKEREKHQEEQLRNVKFSTIGQMAAGITHEINTPLTYIKGNFEMMYEDIQMLEESTIKKNLLQDSEAIKDGLNRVGKIIESMREVSQKNSEKKEITNIYNTLISALVVSHNKSKQIVQITVDGRNFDITMSRDEKVFLSEVQKQRVEQVWIVIINNALDELVKIKEYENRRLDISLAKDSQNVIVNFQDNAGGIKEEILPKIFEPFESTKESSGIGIGLNIAKKIVDDQNGTITALNKDKGALFIVTLPLHNAK